MAKSLIQLSKYTTPLHRFLPASLKLYIKRKSVRELVSIEELKPHLERSCQYLADKIGEESIGDYLEFGVAHGTSLNCMYQVLNGRNYDHIRLFGFDSFEGLPALSDKDDSEVWSKGLFKSDIDVTKYYLTQNGIDWERTFLIEGWFSYTLNESLKKEYNIEKAGIIMIDSDIYSSAKEALQFCESLIKDVVIIIFDDWRSGNLDQKNKGEKLAFTEFMNENPHLSAKEFGTYSFEGKPNGKLFIVEKI
ncbi:MAG: TylF/MycF/NovP-related O-methyltransferase [Balneolaceae bacterium]|nr:TylF/MycF/NovP-related O-methyltransferase [Balneolaceae bacterium]